MKKEFKQKLQKFEENCYSQPHFSEKIAKQTERYINFARKIDASNKIVIDENIKRPNTEKLAKRTERSSLRELLNHAETTSGLQEMERQVQSIKAIFKDLPRNEATRAFYYKDLSICMQALEETKNESEAYSLVSALFDFISNNCLQSVNPDYIMRTISKATAVLEADGKEITHFPKTEETELV